MPQRQTYYVSIPPAEVLARVAASIDLDRGYLYKIVGFQGGHHGIVGCVTDEGFWISRPSIFRRNAFFPVLYGRVHPSDAGARIEMRHRDYRLFKSLLWGGAIVLLALCLPLAVAGRFDPLMLAPPALLALGFGFLKLGELSNRDIDAALDETVARWFADVMVQRGDHPAVAGDARA